MKWKGYDDDDNTWEPEQNVDCQNLMYDYEKKSKGKNLKEKKNKFVKKRPLPTENFEEKHADEKRRTKEVAPKADSNKVRRINMAPTGFERGLKPEKITDVVKSTGELMFRMKWYVDITPY